MESSDAGRGRNFPPKNYSRLKKCGESCISRKHAAILLSMVNSEARDADDRMLASYLNDKCGNFPRVRDRKNVTVLHGAALNGRLDLVKWLVNRKRVDINVCDLDRRSTLHYAVSGNHLSVILECVRLGSLLTQKDKRTMTALDYYEDKLNRIHLCKNGLRRLLYPETKHCESTGEPDIKVIKYPTFCNEDDDLVDVLMKGGNTNYTHGCSSVKGKNSFEIIEFFADPDRQVESVIMREFHTLFVTKSKRVYSCGVGTSGRLGLGREDNVILPRQISYLPCCRRVNMDSGWTQASAGRDHSIFLCVHGTVATCGKNIFYQLGCDKKGLRVLEPTAVSRTVFKNQRIIGVEAASFHSVVWSEQEVYVSGFNNGQFGNMIDKNQPAKKFQSIWVNNEYSGSVKVVVASDYATLLVTTYQFFYLFYQHRLITLELRKGYTLPATVLKGKTIIPQYEITVVKIRGGYGKQKEQTGAKSSTVTPQEQILKVVAITKGGYVFLWEEGCEVLTKCRFHKSLKFYPIDVAIIRDGYYFVNWSGEVYYSKVEETIIKPYSLPKDEYGFEIFDDFQDKLISMMKVDKIKGIQHAIGISCDPKANNVCIIQRRILRETMALFNQIYSNEFSNKMQGDYAELTKMQEELFTTATCDDNLQDLKIETNGGTLYAHKVIVATKVPELFENCLDVDIVTLDVDHRIVEKYLQLAYSNRQFSNDLGQKGLPPFLFDEEDWHEVVWSSDDMNSAFHSKYDLQRFPELYDAKIFTKDGKCLYAHRAILALKVEAWRSLFVGGSFRENRDRNMCVIDVPVRYEVLKIFIDYIYTGSIMQTFERSDVGLIVNLLEFSGAYFVPHFDFFLGDILQSFVTLSNAIEILTIARIFNLSILLRYCSIFVFNNVPTMIHRGYFDTIRDRNEFYENLDKVAKDAYEWANIRAEEMISYKNVWLSQDALRQYKEDPSTLVEWQDIDEPISDDLMTNEFKLNVGNKGRRSAKPSDSTFPSQTGGKPHNKFGTLPQPQSVHKGARQPKMFDDANIPQKDAESQVISWERLPSQPQSVHKGARQPMMFDDANIPRKDAESQVISWNQSTNSQFPDPNLWVEGELDPWYELQSPFITGIPIGMIDFQNVPSQFFCQNVPVQSQPIPPNEPLLSHFIPPRRPTENPPNEPLLSHFIPPRRPMENERFLPNGRVESQFVPRTGSSPSNIAPRNEKLEWTTVEGRGISKSIAACVNVANAVKDDSDVMNMKQQFTKLQIGGRNNEHLSGEDSTESMLGQPIEILMSSLNIKVKEKQGDMKRARLNHNKTAENIPSPERLPPSPVSPWKNIPPISCATEVNNDKKNAVPKIEEKVETLDEIIAQERNKKCEKKKMFERRKRPLSIIQAEDAAINALTSRYKSNWKTRRLHIVVERVVNEENVEAPKWIPNKNALNFSG